MTPLQTLRKHVTGKIESGHAVAIVGIPSSDSIQAQIKLQQTSSRAVYVAYHNREIIGEFRGYGKTESERIDSARKQAVETVKSR